MATLRDLAGYGGGFDAGRFIQLDQAGQRQRTLSELGQQASSGDLQGAERTAWAGGQTDIAAALRGMNQEDHERLVQDTASFALSADTPEKWQALGQQFAQAHPGFDIPPFQARQALIDRAVPVAEQLRMRQAQSNADREYALEQQKLARGGDGTGQFFGTPLPYRKPDGSVGYALPSKAGGVKALDLPGGEFLGPFERASDSAAGKVEGTNRGNLPNALAAGDRIVRGIDDVLADPYLPKMVGPVDQWLPNVSGDANRVQAKLDQIQGGTFLQAYNDLRGGGQITEKEGEKATAAYNRLSAMGQDNADYTKALNEFKTEVLKLMDIARTRAGQGGAGSAAPAAPAGGGWSIEPVQ
jgi:hypothetical protein